MELAVYPENLLNSQDAFHKDGSQLVSNPRQQEAKKRDAKYGIKNAKDFPALRARSYVSITCWNNGNANRKRGEEKAVNEWGKKNTAAKSGGGDVVRRMEEDETEEHNKDFLMQQDQLDPLCNTFQFLEQRSEVQRQ